MPELLILAAALCWAVGLVMMRGLSVRVPALQLNATRILAPAAAFLLLVLATGRLGEIASLPRPNLLAIVVSVVLGIGMGDALLFVAIRRIGVARAFALASTPGLAIAPLWRARLLQRGGSGDMLALRLAGLALVVGAAWALGHGVWQRVQLAC
ncbi:MAG: EamA family transporter [Proteobacteria bacterium]|nr:EamA family transporter [Pseudomonadota bacterium]